MGQDRITELEQKIAELKASWPAHSVPTSMWLKLEELESQLEAEIKKQQKEKK